MSQGAREALECSHPQTIEMSGKITCRVCAAVWCAECRRFFASPPATEAATLREALKRAGEWIAESDAPAVQAPDEEWTAWHAKHNREQGEIEAIIRDALAADQPATTEPAQP